MTAVEPGSFRDPSGQVFETNGRIFRTITARALADYTFLRDTGVLRRLVDDGRLVAAEEVDPLILGNGAREAPVVVEHPRIPFISYPYEWPFPALKAAALFHLRARFERPRLGTYTSFGSQDTFNEGVTRGSVRCAQKRNCSRVRVPCRDRSTSPAVYVRVISWRVRFQNGLYGIVPRPEQIAAVN